MTEANANAAQSYAASHSDDVIKEERRKSLQQRLKHEMQKHITEGSVGAAQIQEHVGRIQQLRQELRQEAEAGPVKEPPSSSSDQLAAGMGSIEDVWQAEFSAMLQSRAQERGEHSALIQQELQRMERELMEKKASGVCDGELSVLQRERHLLLLQVELLCRETHTAETQLHTLHTRHLNDLHTLRQDSLQVFRVFRQVLEEQRRVSEGRYRTILLEAIQDAVLLSAQNQQLQAHNRELQRAVEDLQSAQSKQSDPPAAHMQKPGQRHDTA